MVSKYISKAKENLIKTKQKSLEIKSEFRKQAVTAIIAAFGFLIALSWRDFISSIITKIVTLIGVSDQLYLYQLLSAITVTVLAILGIMIVSKFQIKQEEKETKEEKEIKQQKSKK